MSEVHTIKNRVRGTVEKYFEIEVDDDHPLLEELEVLHLSGGEWLIRQGDEGDALYLVVQGRLRAMVQNPDTENESKPEVLGEIVAGDSVGEISLLTGHPRAASIQAIRDSLLVKIKRVTFDKIAARHPALVMRLAGNVASVLHKSTTGGRAAARNPGTITLLSLDDTARTQRFCQQIVSELADHGSVLHLRPESLGEHGAPVNQLLPESTVPESLKLWLSDQESRHTFVLFQCPPANTPWSRFAQRQSDLVITIADTAKPSAARPWEPQSPEARENNTARRMLCLLQPPACEEIVGTAAWLDARQVDFHIHIREDQPDDTSRVARIVSGTAVGLVLASGAARGFAHLGIYGALREAGIPIDWVGGTSLGAIMGSCMANDWTFEKASEICKTAFVSGKPFSDFTLPLISLARGRRMERLLNKHADFQIEDLPIPFFCVSCNLDSGKLVLHERGYLPDALRASAAMIGIIPPAVLNQRLTVDGSVINSMPIDIMQQKPVGTIIAATVASSKEYLVDYTDLPSPWAVLRGRFLPFTKKYRVPNLSTIMLKATELGTMTQVNEQSKQADLLLNPPVRKFGMTEVSAFDRIVNTGYEYAKVELAAWQERRRTE
jgi:predicted acylesterase/phospholipase RssA/CRP-like cAMP-binding protein